MKDSRQFESSYVGGLQGTIRPERAGGLNRPSANC